VHALSAAHIAAGGNLVTTLVQPATTADVELPRCPKSHVLRSVPDDWASLTAEEQAAHPINLPVMQVRVAGDTTLDRRARAWHERRGAPARQRTGTH
jgi:hypothetical protein